MKTSSTICICLGIVLAAALSVLPGCLSRKSGDLVTDADGRYSYRVSKELESVPTDGTFRHWKHRSPDIDTYIVTADASLEQDALNAAFDRTGIDPTRLKVDGIAGFGHWRLVRYAPEEGIWHAVAYQYRGDTAYAFIVRGGADSDPDSLPSPVFGMLATFTFSEDAGEVFIPSNFAELEAHVDRIVERIGGSVSIAAMKDGALVYEYASGSAAPGIQADDRTAYHWGSISKTVTAVAVMELVEQGKVDLDATADTYLPEFTAGRTVTIRSLLGHSSGLADRPVNHIIGFDPGEVPSIEAAWADYRPSLDAPDYEPGSSVVYSNMNYLVLGMIVSRITSEPLTDYIRRSVFDPLGMDETAHVSSRLPESVREAMPVVPLSEMDDLLNSLEPGGYGRDDAVERVIGDRVYLRNLDILPCWGGVKGTAADAVRYGQLFVDRGSAPGGRILERRTVQLMMKPQKSREGKPMLFGIGWRVGVGRPAYIEHSGGGPGIDSLMRIYPKQGIVIVVFGNVVGYGSGRVLEYTHDLIE